MKLAKKKTRLTQNKEALMNDLILQKLLLLGFAILISACSSKIVSQGRVSHAPSYQSLHDKVDLLHSRYDRH